MKDQRNYSIPVSLSEFTGVTYKSTGFTYMGKPKLHRWTANYRIHNYSWAFNPCLFLHSLCIVCPVILLSHTNITACINLEKGLMDLPSSTSWAFQVLFTSQVLEHSTISHVFWAIVSPRWYSSIRRKQLHNTPVLLLVSTSFPVPCGLFSEAWRR